MLGYEHTYKFSFYEKNLYRTELTSYIEVMDQPSVDVEPVTPIFIPVEI